MTKTKVLLACDDGALRLYTFNPGQDGDKDDQASLVLQNNFRGFKEKLFSCCFHDDDEGQVFASYQGPFIRIFDLKTRNVLRVINLTQAN